MSLSDSRGISRLALLADVHLWLCGCACFSERTNRSKPHQSEGNSWLSKLRLGWWSVSECGEHRECSCNCRKARSGCRAGTSKRIADTPAVQHRGCDEKK